MAEAASKFKGKQVEVEILTDTYKIRGTLFVPLAGRDGYSARLSDKRIRGSPAGPGDENRNAFPCSQQKCGVDSQSDQRISVCILKLLSTALAIISVVAMPVVVH